MTTVKMGAYERTFRAPRDPKRKCNGYHPAIGHPKDAEGNSILEYTYAPEKAPEPKLF